MFEDPGQHEPCPAGRSSGRSCGASVHSVPQRMLASSSSTPAGSVAACACTCTACATALAAALSRVASSACGSMSKQCTARAPSLAAAMRQHSRAAAVVDDARAGGSRAASSQSRHSAVRGMRAGTKREPRIERDDDRAPGPSPAHGAALTHSRRAEAHGVEILEPLAFPDAILDRAGRDLLGAMPSCAASCAVERAALRGRANRACRRVCGHRRNSPGSGSSTGSSSASSSVTARRAAGEAGVLGGLRHRARRGANDSSRKALSGEFQRRPSRRSR